MWDDPFKTMEDTPLELAIPYIGVRIAEEKEGQEQEDRE